MSNAHTSDTPDAVQAASGREPPLVAAYHLGKMLKRLHFVACEFSLGFSDDTQFDQEFDRLRAAARRVVPHDNKEDMQTLIDNGREDLRQMWKSLWWIEEYSERNQELCKSRGGDEYELVREACCSAVLGPIQDVIDDLRDQINGHLDERGKSALRFGEVIERMQCHVTLIRSLPPPKNPPAPTAVRTIGELLLTCSEAKPPMRNLLASKCRFDSVDIASIKSWLSDLRQRWTEFGLADADFPVDEHCGGSVTNSSGLVRLIEQIDGAFQAAIVASLTTSPLPNDEPPRPGWLGLVLDQDNYKVCRDGNVHREKLTRLEFEALRLFLRARGGFTDRDHLKEAWSAAECSPDPQKETIDNLVSDLRRILKRLGVDIVPTRRKGWQLVEVETESTRSHRKYRRRSPK